MTSPSARAKNVALKIMGERALLGIPLWKRKKLENTVASALDAESRAYTEIIKSLLHETCELGDTCDWCRGLRRAYTAIRALAEEEGK
jgi:hypothetical protein